MIDPQVEMLSAVLHEARSAAADPTSDDETFARLERDVDRVFEALRARAGLEVLPLDTLAMHVHSFHAPGLALGRHVRAHLRALLYRCGREPDLVVEIGGDYAADRAREALAETPHVVDAMVSRGAWIVLVHSNDLDELLPRIAESARWADVPLPLFVPEVVLGSVRERHPQRKYVLPPIPPPEHGLVLDVYVGMGEGGAALMTSDGVPTHELEALERLRVRLEAMPSRY